MHHHGFQRVAGSIAVVDTHINGMLNSLVLMQHPSVVDSAVSLLVHYSTLLRWERLLGSSRMIQNLTLAVINTRL